MSLVDVDSGRTEHSYEVELPGAWANVTGRYFLDHGGLDAIELPDGQIVPFAVGDCRAYHRDPFIRALADVIWGEIQKFSQPRAAGTRGSAAAAELAGGALCGTAPPA